ncbi:MAG: hypothetical protein ACRCZF_21340, partial [Gemmataceae bacterium]
MFRGCFLLLLLATPLALAQVAPANDAMLVTLQNPLTSAQVQQLQNRVAAARGQTQQPLKKLIIQFNPNNKPATSSDFGTAYSLATFVRSLHEVKTIAFVQANVTGHLVLPLLACKEVAVGSTASIGDILPSGEPFGEAMKAGYDEVLGDARVGLKAVVRKMADRQVSLGRGTKNGAAFYVDLRDVPAALKLGVQVPDTSPVPFGGPGTPGLFGIEPLKTFGIATVRADTRQELADLYQLNLVNLREDLSVGRAPVAYRVLFRGPVDPGLRESTRRLLRDLQSRQATHLFVEL